MSLAVYEHHTEIAMLLVHRGAEVNIVEEVNNATTNTIMVNDNHLLLIMFLTGRKQSTDSCMY